jgi:GAF domain-containing protein
MQSDLITHNRVARLAADLTPAAFVCLITYDSDLNELNVSSVSGTNTPLFSQVNAAARREEAGWNPSINMTATTNPAFQKVIFGEKPHHATVREFCDGVIKPQLFDSVFSKFTDNSCFAVPIIVQDQVYGALMFVSPERFTKPQELSCLEFVEQCRNSVSSLIEEQRLTEEIENLTEQLRRIQMNDPLGLTQRSGSAFRTPRSFRDIRLSLETQTAVRGDRELNLTRREFDLLDTFLQSPGTALSRVQIVSRVWVERNSISSNVLNVTVKNLREKLEADGEPRVIHSLRAYGYVLK